jgi:competence protein ComGC
MVFNGSPLFIVLLIGIVAWISILTYILVRMVRHYNRITGEGQKRGLREILDMMSASITRLEKRNDENRHDIEALKDDGAKHVQRIGIVHFNPFADTGGAQSSSIAILDARKSGIIMTTLYARAGNRSYVKEIIEGKCKELDLSKEEKEAIEKAVRGG